MTTAKMTPASDDQRMTGAQAIVECMKQESVEKVFCVPGESYLPLLDALHDEPTIDVITARHEGGASFMAEGYGKASLKPGVLIATRGVGATNLSIGVHTAYQDSTPMVVFLGQIHRRFRGREAFQEIDLEAYFQPITKWATEIREVERIPEIVQRAFRIAQSGRPGPVVLSIPEDVWPLTADMSFGPVSKISKPTPVAEELERIQTIMTQAKKPLIIAGGGVKSAQAEDALVQFAEKYQLPVMSAFRRQDVFPNHHSLYVGHLGLGTDQALLTTVQEADVILALATRLSEVTTQDYSLITHEQKLIHIDIDDETLGKVYPPDVGIVADANQALQALSKLTIERIVWKDWVKQRNQAFRHTSALDIKEDDALNKKIMAVLMEQLPADALLTNDAGNFAGWLHAFYSFKQKKTYVGPTSGAMGYGLPAALGAQLAFPHKKVLSLSGDGGFMMTVQEMETAVRHHIPIIALVFNNDMYGTIRMHQEINYPGKVVATDLGHVHFAHLARSVGAEGYTVTTIEAFHSVLAQVLQKSKPTVIEIITGQEQISVSSTITQIRNRQGAVKTNRKE